MHAKISEVVRHIKAHFAEPLRLDAIAEHFFISPFYLSRMFKEITGFTFSDYIIKITHASPRDYRKHYV
ncbi:AraC family transcriptional regulator [Paenibacillus sp. sgz302251]|uniref:AraC family transcriptional regulator n=1 Tax=Paenibacillus sp. sgz302251 TaxID=3414493 RepID=UPI003C7BC34E